MVMGVNYRTVVIILQCTQVLNQYLLRETDRMLHVNYIFIYHFLKKPYCTTTILNYLHIIFSFYSLLY